MQKYILRIFAVLTVLFLCGLFFTQPPAHAHLAIDLYHTATLKFNRDTIDLTYEISTDPVIFDDFLKYVDTNKNKYLDKEEVLNYVNKDVTPHISADLNGTKLTPTMQSILIASEDKYYSGDTVITVQYKIPNVIYQDKNDLTVDIDPHTADFQYEIVYFNDNFKDNKDFANSAVNEDLDTGRTYKVSFQKNFQTSQTTHQAVSSQQSGFDFVALSQQWVNDIMKKFNPTNPYYLAFAIAFAFISGFIHSLTPGHGKSIITAYLIGTQRKKFRDILILGSSVTFSHTILIFILGFLLLTFTSLFTVNSILPYFTMLSSGILIFLGVSLLRQSYSVANSKAKPGSHSHGFFEHSHETDHDLINKRSQKQEFSVAQLFLVGLGGGIIPCAEALSLLIFAAKAGYTALGLFLVFFFSIGLAAAIVLIGLLITKGQEKMGGLEKYSRILQIVIPAIIGVGILLYGIYSVGGALPVIINALKK